MSHVDFIFAVQKANVVYIKAQTDFLSESSHQPPYYAFPLGTFSIHVLLATIAKMAGRFGGGVFIFPHGA